MAKTVLCSIEGCSKGARTKGWCSMHYWRWSKYGDPLKLMEKPENPKLCSVDDCTRTIKSMGMCNAHYLKNRKYGNPLFGKKFTKNGEPSTWLRENASHLGEECLIWPYAKGRDGRGRIQGDVSPQAHRAMCILSHGNPPSDIHEAAHTCGRGHQACVNPRHLYWATPIENAEDKWRHGTQRHGEACWKAKLTIGQVREIRLLKGKMSQSAIGHKYGVDGETIGDIYRRKTWNWFDDPDR